MAGRLRRAGFTATVSLILFSALAGLAARAAQKPGPPAATPAPAGQLGLPAAMGKIQAGDFAGALAILEPLAAREPASPQVWRALGLARLKTKDLDGAAAAFAKSLELEPGSPRAFYNLGVVAALKNRPDEAFEWLGKAR